MPKILISDSLSDIAKEVFENNNIDVDVITDLKPDNLKGIIKYYDGLVVRSVTNVSKEIIETADKLKIIGRAGAGIDNIDVVTAKKKNIIVMNTPGGNTNATAEHTISLILSLYRKIPETNDSTHKGLWEKKKYKGLELRGKKIGLIGFGNVAQRVAEIVKGFDMEISVFSESFESRKDNFSNIKSLPLDEILSFCDIISLHCNSQKNGNPIINLSELKKMKKNAVIINTARGNLINEVDLNTALKESIIKGAALDVYSEEPAKNNILFGANNLILTPHIAASTEDAQIIVAKQIAEQISEFFNTGKITNSV